MDTKLLFSTFFAVLLAEMGDKTQLATMSLSAASNNKWTVFGASALALVTSTAIAVLLGDVIARHVSPLWIKRAAGGMFLILGTLMLFSRAES